MHSSKSREWAKNIAARSAIVIFFIMAFEVMIMISPFAFFFYSVFAPFFNFLGQHAATRWLTLFFLPHMILPPSLFLKTVRLTGSFFFVVGCLAFFVCAAQVYLGKIFKWGIAARGLYKYVRHPQYLALALWGVGMAILWPRFIVLATLSIMFVLYYFLAADEERRMLHTYGESYDRYRQRTGKFLPLALEKPLAAVADWIIPATGVRLVVVPVLIITLVLGSGLLLRQVTLRSLLFESKENLTVVPILPEDSRGAGGILNGIIAAEALNEVPFLKNNKQYLGYVMPVDYIMQGMLADTGGHFHLFKKHHTVGLILDWVFHPFDHLRRPPAAQMAASHQADPQMARRHHCPLEINQAGMECDTCTYRRVILVEIGEVRAGSGAGPDLLAMDTHRTPVGFVDIDTQTEKIVGAKGVGAGSAWKDVPTPEI